MIRQLLCSTVAGGGANAIRWQIRWARLNHEQKSTSKRARAGSHGHMGPCSQLVNQAPAPAAAARPLHAQRRASGERCEERQGAAKQIMID